MEVLTEKIDNNNFENTVVEEIVNSIQTCIDQSNECHICISGGSTPLSILQILATKKIEWKKIFIYQTDERVTSITSRNSNYFNLKNTLALAKRINFPNMYRGDVKKSISEYKEYLRKNKILNKSYSFDLLILGFGNDGHIASIFPDNHIDPNVEIFHLREKKASFERISLGIKILSLSKKTLIISYGEEKHKILKDLKKNLPIHIFLKSVTNYKWYSNINGEKNKSDCASSYERKL